LKILAVHADDELLGAFALLHYKPTVILLDPTRRVAGSFKLAELMGHEIHYMPWDYSPEGWQRIVEKLVEMPGELWVTSPRDHHPDHKIAATIAHRRPVNFYTVLPIGFKLVLTVELSPELFAQKRELFARLFPAEPYGELLEAVGPFEYYERNDHVDSPE